MKINILSFIITLSIVFAISEFLLMIVKHSKIKNAKNREDRGSMILIWAMITLGFTGGFFLAKHYAWVSINTVIACMGLLVILNGIIIRWVAILQLGKAFTVDVAITEAARLKTDGIYAIIRHPSYSGLITIIIGFAITMNSLSSFLVLVLPVMIAIIYRINVEEKVLLNEFGNSYLEYKSRTKKLIPGIY